MLKVGDNVNILDSSVDCPTMRGVVIDHIEGSDEYGVMYHDGVDYTYGMFYPFDLTKSETQWNSHS